jgi:hypothetical protein
MRISELLTESLSTVVFHATTVDGANEIIRTGALKGSKLNNEYFISFARNRTGDYPKYMGANMEGTTAPIVVFELDGRIISSNHKSSPVDPFYDKQDEERWGYERTINYQEDRLALGSDKFLKIKKSAIRKLHVIVNGSSVENVRLVQGFNENRMVAFYSSLRDFMQRKQSKKPSVQLEWKDVVAHIESLLFHRKGVDKIAASAAILQFSMMSRENHRKVLSYLRDEDGTWYGNVEKFLETL